MNKHKDSVLCLGFSRLTPTNINGAMLPNPQPSPWIFAPIPYSLRLKCVFQIKADPKMGSQHRQTEIVWLMPGDLDVLEMMTLRSFVEKGIFSMST